MNLQPIVVFAGPSLDAEEARTIAGPRAIVLPPAAAGDIIRALRLNPVSIVLIDGRFDDVPSPWHKEILLALEYGVAVYGAASMGALRIAECATYGAVPVGGIATSYLEGRREDDAVAIAHLPAAGGWRTVSTALVDIEAALAEAVAAGRTSKAEAETALRESRELHFPSRRMPEICGSLAGSRGLKERDAAEACRRARDEADTPRPPGERVPRTTWLLRLARLALGSPFPSCPDLPPVERSFQEIVKLEPWLGPLIMDAIGFEFVDASHPVRRLSASRQDALRDHHLGKVDRTSARRVLGERLALRVAERQITMLEAGPELLLGFPVLESLGSHPSPAAVDDARTRVLRSEGVPPVRDAILDRDPRDLADTLQRMVDGIFE